MQNSKDTLSWSSRVKTSVIFKLSPLKWAGLLILISIAFTLIVPFIRDYIIDGIGWWIGLVLAYLLLLSFSYGLIVTIFNYPFNSKTLKDMYLYFLSTVILFANAYFLMMIFSTPQDLPFKDINPFGPVNSGTIGKFKDPVNSLVTFIDCLHYSVVVATTLGFGDITPRLWFAKLTTDVQVLSSLSFVTFTLGKFFF